MKYFYLTLSLLLTLPFESAIAQIQYDNPLVDFAGYQTGEAGLDSFVNLIYGIAISLAALLAVIKIVIAGMKWMLSDIVTDKSDAKKDIQGALFGLIIILAAVLIITVINPDIVGPASN